MELDEKRITKYPIVTICGSSKFMDGIKSLQSSLEMLGAIVFIPAIFNYPSTLDTMSAETEIVYDVMHKAKMCFSDVVIIYNENNYYGDDTRKEIEYAERNGIPVIYKFSDKEIEMWSVADIINCCNRVKSIRETVNWFREKGGRNI